MIHNNKIKIADFGFARTIEEMDNPVNLTALGTPMYLPIQILNQQKYSSKCDVFSTGVMLYEMLTGRHPFYHDKRPTNLQSLVQI